MQKCLLTSYTYDVLLKPVSQVDVDVGGFVDGEGLEGVDGVPDGRRLRESGGQQHKRERERERGCSNAHHLPRKRKLSLGTEVAV